MNITIAGVKYEFDSEKLMLSEARSIEKVCGCTFQEWSERLQAGSMEALAALVWIVQSARTLSCVSVRLTLRLVRLRSMRTKWTK